MERLRGRFRRRPLAKAEQEPGLGRLGCARSGGLVLQDGEGFFTRVPNPMQRANDAHARKQHDENKKQQAAKWDPFA